MKKFYLLSLAFGLAIGCALGIWYAGVFLYGTRTIDAMLARSSALEYSFLQYKLSDAQHSRGALLFSAEFLDDLEVFVPSPVAKFEAGVSYGRLALVEEAAGNHAQSQAYFQKAKECYKGTKDEAGVIEIVKKLDRL
jgi:hypothetical protein